MIKTEYLGWTLLALSRHPAAPSAAERWSARYERSDLLIVGWGSTPESALAAAQKQIKTREGGTQRSVASTLRGNPRPGFRIVGEPFPAMEKTETPIADRFDDMARTSYMSANKQQDVNDALRDLRAGNDFYTAAENARRLKL